MISKTEQVRLYVRDRNYKQALAICKDWIHPLSKEESDILKRGYECYQYPDFYRQIGYNPEEEINKSISILNKLYK